MPRKTENFRSRSKASKRGWETRRHNERSAAAKRGWETRRKREQERERGAVKREKKVDEDRLSRLIENYENRRRVRPDGKIEISIGSGPGQRWVLALDYTRKGKRGR